MNGRVTLAVNSIGPATKEGDLFDPLQGNPLGDQLAKHQGDVRDHHRCSR